MILRILRNLINQFKNDSIYMINNFQKKYETKIR